MKYKIWPGTVQTIWQSDYLERRSGPWLEPCPRSRAVRDTSLLITAEIRRSKLTHRSLECRGPSSAAPPGQSRDDDELFPYQSDLSSSWPNWAGVRRRPSNCPWADQGVFEGCGVKILPSNGHKSPSIDVQCVDVLGNISLFGNSAYLPLILLVSTKKRWTLMAYT